MKYYSLESCGIETTKFCEPEVFGEWEDEFLKGNYWKDRSLKLPITMSVANKYNPGDYPLADSHLVSQRLLNIIKRLNNDFEVLPTQLFYKAKEPIWDTYYTLLFPDKTNVKNNLIKILYHRVTKDVEPMYKKVLNITFNNSKHIQDLVNTRHSLVHRNGKDENGTPIVLTKKIVSDAVNDISVFIQDIDTQLKSMII